MPSLSVKLMLAREAVLGATQVWSRDPGSHEILIKLVGDEYDPAVHRTGVDMAFGLVAERPPEQAIAPIADWLDGRTPIIGLNVSGLVWRLDGGSTEQFGFKADYRALVRQLVLWLLRESTCGQAEYCARENKEAMHVHIQRGMLRELNTNTRRNSTGLTGSKSGGKPAFRTVIY